MAYTGTRSSRRGKQTQSLTRTAPTSAPLTDTTSRHVIHPARSDISAAINAVGEVPPQWAAQLRAAELAEHLEWVADACAHGEVEPCASGSVAVLRRRLVELVRQRLVAQWSARTPDASMMVDSLQRLERAQLTCVVSGEQALAAELSDYGAANFMVEVAHDLRSPLTSIVFMSEVLHRGQSGPLTPLQQRQLGIVYSAAIGLTGLVSDLIEIGRTGRRRTADKPMPFAVNGVLGSISDLVKPLVVEKDVSFIIDPLHEDRRLGHPGALGRILLNLTTNALKYTHEGSVTLSAHNGGGNCVQFSVTDTGPGIPDEALAMLYEPFRHEPRRDTGYVFSGTGLGLAICRRLVEELGSHLLVETSPGGTRFTFDVDLAPASSL